MSQMFYPYDIGGICMLLTNCDIKLAAGGHQQRLCCTNDCYMQCYATCNAMYLVVVVILSVGM